MLLLSDNQFTNKVSIMRYLLLALSFISTSVLAIPYEFTNGSQLLRDSGNRIVCYAWASHDCDVQPGDYTLYDYSTDPATITDITIAEEVGRVVVSEQCLFPSPLTPSTGERCEAVCPSGKVVTEVLSCTAVEYDTGTYVGSGFRTDGGKFMCQVAPSDYAIQVFAKVVCE